MAEEQQESSVLFSLQELMSIEEDRIKTEEDDKTQAEQQAEQARLDTERQAREAEEARIAAEEERRRQEEQAAREEEARLEAIRQAEIGKAQAETEQRARMEAMAAQQQHERQLAALAQDKQKKNLRNAVIGVAVLLVVGAVGGTALYIRAADQAERDRLAAEADKKQREEEVAKLERQKKQQDETLAQMREMLATLKADSVEAKKLREQIEALEKNSGRTGSRPIRRTGTSGGASKAPPPPSCAPGDPLCSDI